MCSILRENPGTKLTAIHPPYHTQNYTDDNGKLHQACCRLHNGKLHQACCRLHRRQWQNISSLLQITQWQTIPSLLQITQTTMTNYTKPAAVLADWDHRALLTAAQCRMCREDDS